MREFLITVGVLVIVPIWLYVVARLVSSAVVRSWLEVKFGIRAGRKRKED